jgi:hypothetical protein
MVTTNKDFANEKCHHHAFALRWRARHENILLLSCLNPTNLQIPMVIFSPLSRRSLFFSHQHRVLVVCDSYVSKSAGKKRLESCRKINIDNLEREKKKSKTN